MPRLGILTSHPIQYQAPLFRALSEEMEMEVFFSHRQNSFEQGEAGFEKGFEWDTDLLSGYSSRFLKNTAHNPGVDRFFGCDNPELKQIICDGQFDTFLLMGWHLKSYWQAVIACKKLGVPVMVRGDSHLHTHRSFLKRLIKEPVYRLMLGAFDAFLFVGNWNKEYLLHYGANKDHLFFAPHCVDNRYFHDQAAKFTAVESLEMRRTLGIDSLSHVILFVGKFQPLKRPLDLIKALSKVRHKNIEVVFIGSGELEDRIKEIAKLENTRLHMPGFINQSQLPGYYAIADLLVLPSEKETWGMVVNEAMAVGTPVIVSDGVGCGSDMIDVGKTGLIFPVGDIEAMANAIDKMLALANTSEIQMEIEEKNKQYSISRCVKGVQQALNHLQQRGVN